MKPDPQTEKQALAALRALNDAIRQRDVKSAMALFAPDVIMIASEFGEIAKTPSEVQASFERVFNGPLRYSFFWDECTINVLGDVIWLFAEGLVQTMSEAGVHEHPYRVTGVLRRVGSEWRWVQYHGSEPTA